jgi:hypothetical protein
MIHITLNINSPFSVHKTKHYFIKDWKISKTKRLSIQLSKLGNSLIGFSFSYNHAGRDHAGLDMNISLFNHYFIITLYDTRHWYHEKNRWYEKGEEERLYK